MEGFGFGNEFTYAPRIIVVGVGGGGSNAVVNSLVPQIPTVTNDNKETQKPAEINAFDDIENVAWAHDAIIRLYKDKVIRPAMVKVSE